MASRTMAIRAVVVAVLLLMQCCNVVLAARLLEGDGAGWLRGKGVAGVGALVMQLLPKDTPGAPGTPNGCTTDPSHAPSGPCN